MDGHTPESYFAADIPFVWGSAQRVSGGHTHRIKLASIEIETISCPAKYIAELATLEKHTFNSMLTGRR